ncbi:hypothetical protein H6F67_21920 [Microcoleus sp. FACHB-1515]|uniref:hypothetical protein n=1 Tax=Cyanophyceae TaxID=3028117 RepID=UPI001689C33A|nr:hypothetical protein [Microcoleus sp. FACHB-1515]MBD2092510.1 hypothetical protein [Microcoleus sp. FACHB-1515]
MKNTGQTLMELQIKLDSIELDFVTTAAATFGTNGLSDYAKAVTIAASEIVIVNRIDQLRPLAESLPDAKASLETLTRALETAWAIGLPEVNLQVGEDLTDVDELIARLRDLLSDLQAFLRRHHS